MPSLCKCLNQARLMSQHLYSKYCFVALEFSKEVGSSLGVHVCGLFDIPHVEQSTNKINGTGHVMDNALEHTRYSNMGGTACLKT